MDASKGLKKDLDELKCITIELVDLCKDCLDENHVIVLLNSVPNTFREVKNDLQYGRDGSNFDIIVSPLRMRDVELTNEKKELGKGDRKDIVMVSLYILKENHLRKRIDSRKREDHNQEENQSLERKKLGVGHVKKKVMLDVIVQSSRKT